MEPNEQFQLDVDLSKVRDQITRRIWDMTQISLQGPGYARGYADGLSESLVVLDNLSVNPFIHQVRETRKILEELSLKWIALKGSNNTASIDIDDAVAQIASIIDDLKSTEK